MPLTQAPAIDMSPMIDLVFLLLIFFMVASTAITYRKDKNVTVPVASDSVVPKNIENRIVLNVYQDGTIKDELGKVLTTGQVETRMAEAKKREPKTRLHLRCDKAVPHRMVKDVIAASARGGVSSVIFSTYQTEK